MRGLVSLHSSVQHHLLPAPPVSLYDIQSLSLTRLERRVEYPFPDLKERIILSERIARNLHLFPSPLTPKCLSAVPYFSASFSFLNGRKNIIYHYSEKEKKNPSIPHDCVSLSFSSSLCMRVLPSFVYAQVMLMGRAVVLLAAVVLVIVTVGFGEEDQVRYQGVFSGFR